jgi:hypothetical protein
MIAVLRAEWVKFATVRGWVIGMLAAFLVVVGLGLLTAKDSACGMMPTASNPSGACLSPPTGPGGDWVSDSFYFVRQPLSGDGIVTVRVTSLAGEYSTGGVPGIAGRSSSQLPPMAPGLEPWDKAGIIIKASTAEGSAYAAMMVTGSHGVRMQWNYTHDSPGLPGSASAASPRWLCLVRSGDTVTGYDSADGTRWTRVGTASLAGLPATMQTGLFAASPGHSTSTTSLGGSTDTGAPSFTTGVFDHVSLSRAGTPDGAASAGPGPGASTGGWTGTALVSASQGTSPVLIHAESFRQAGGAFTVTGTGDIAPATGGGVGSGPSNVLTGLFAALIAVTVIAVMFITAEYRRGLIRLTFSATPRRGRTLLAKAAVIAAVTFAAGLAAIAVTVPLGERLLRENGNVVEPLSVLTQMRVEAGLAALLAVAAVLALAIGALLRRSAAAVAVALAVIVLPYILGTFGGLLPPAAEDWVLRLTPAAAFAIQQTSVAYPQVTASYTPPGGYFPLAPWAGFAVLCAWTAVALAAAACLLRRTDA